VGTDGLSAEQVLTRTYHLLQGWERCAYLFADLYWIDLQRPEGERMRTEAWTEPAEWLAWPAEWLLELYGRWTAYEPAVEALFRFQGTRPLVESIWRLDVVREHLEQLAGEFRDGTYSGGLEPLQKTIVLLQAYREETATALGRTPETIPPWTQPVEMDVKGLEATWRVARLNALKSELEADSGELDQRIRLSLRWSMTQLLDPSIAKSWRTSVALHLNETEWVAGWEIRWTPILEGERPVVYEHEHAA
jgi:hypothetical protein